MERIKQAIEKAREERLRAGGTLPLSAPTAVPASPEQIVYNHTRNEEVSSVVLREKRIVTAADMGPLSDAYKILRTQVLQRLRENNWNALAVTSPGTSEGKTLTAINLAISLAREVNYTVLLVDADLRNPSVHSYFGLKPQRGLSEYLIDNASLSELLIHPADMGRLVILPGGRPLDNSSEMLNSPKMTRLVEELKSRYQSRIVLFDLPPLLVSADTLAFSPYVDAALLVIEEGKTPAPEIQRAVELLEKTRLIGTVLNKSHTANSNNEQTEHWPERVINWLQDNRLIGSILAKFGGGGDHPEEKTP